MGDLARSPSPRRVVVALGGNAILRGKQLNSYADQFENVRRTSRQMAQLVAAGYQLVLTHGNGPQVGNLLIQNEAAADLVPPVPLDVCGAEPFSAGSMGPKVRAAYRFVHDGGRQATICALEDALAGLRGDAGTVVERAEGGRR